MLVSALMLMRHCTVGFFKNNPALDVPMQQDAKSVMAFSEGTSNGTGANGTHVDPEAAKCCS